MSEVTQCIHCPFSDRIGPHGPGPVLVLEVEKECPACQAVLRQRRRTRFVCYYGVQGPGEFVDAICASHSELEVRAEEKITAVRGSGTIVLEGTIEV